MPAPPPVPPVVVIAGTEPREFVDELLGEPVPGHSASAYVSLRHGPTGGQAWVPGHREPRELTAEGPAGPPTRPPRRVVLTRDVPLLAFAHLVVAPATAATTAGTEVLRDAVAHTDGLLYLLDAGVPLAPNQREELAAAVAVTPRLVMVDLRDAGDDDRAVLTRQVPALAGATWMRAADLTGLRDLLTGWSRRTAEEVLARADDDPARTLAVGAVSVTDDDVRWRTALDRDLKVRADAVRQRLAADLVALESRCGGDPAALPAVLDIELHALSLRTSEALDRAARAGVRAVFEHVVDGPLADHVLARVATAVRRQVDLDDRTLLVTATAGVAAVAGCGHALSCTGIAGSALLPPIGVAVSGNCHLMWRYRGVPDKAEGRRWLRQAVQSLERELDRAVAERFALLREAIEALAADAIDHGVLLA
ncbi:hypothetical protein Val02_90340 [Virgisporangium aliadipatigenens]|uniref:Uncharacterized protein n=1 Tax=Virgisporangium aliadipatigenens TaxID=741659 RepID=A0A8J3YYX8_9ACTN|nr:hypothetical protein [Virgisporangium aliadipatigenens]GIJ52148.1 hypothetical protein Val02_90340 [Virgisporangium aliadipatigenens]